MYTRGECAQQHSWVHTTRTREALLVVQPAPLGGALEVAIRPSLLAAAVRVLMSGTPIGNYIATSAS